MNEGMDKELESLFLEKNDNLSPEPFVENTIKVIRKRESWRVFGRRMIYLSALCCCVLLSQFLIRASMLLSRYLSDFFNVMGKLIDKPVGLAAAFLCCTFLVFIFRRKLVSVFL